MMWYGHDMGGGLVALLLGILTAAVVIAIVFRVLDRPDRAAQRHHPSPDELLADRYARGEITDDEYRHRLAVLHGREPAAR